MEWLKLKRGRAWVKITTWNVSVIIRISGTVWLHSSLTRDLVSIIFYLKTYCATKNIEKICFFFNQKTTANKSGSSIEVFLSQKNSWWTPYILVYENIEVYVFTTQFRVRNYCKCWYSVIVIQFHQKCKSKSDAKLSITVSRSLKIYLAVDDPRTLQVTKKF